MHFPYFSHKIDKIILAISMYGWKNTNECHKCPTVVYSNYAMLHSNIICGVSRTCFLPVS